MKISATWPAPVPAEPRKFPYLARHKKFTADVYLFVTGRSIDQSRALNLNNGITGDYHTDDLVPLETGVKIILEQE